MFFVESRREMREGERTRVCSFGCECFCVHVSVRVRPRALFTSIEASKNRVSSQLWFG